VIERRDGVDALRKARGVELQLPLLVRHDVAAADFGLETFDVAAQPAVSAEKLSLN
jgi:hypothetical protein